MIFIIIIIIQRLCLLPYPPSRTVPLLEKFSHQTTTERLKVII